MSTSIAQVVGANARRLRMAHGLNLDQFAQAARFCGLPWSTGRVGDLEAGRVGTSLETTYAVALALHQVTGQPVLLADLFASDGPVQVGLFAPDDDGPVQINDELTVKCSALADAMSGKPVTGETENYRRLGQVMDKGMASLIRGTDEWKRLPQLVRRNLDPLEWMRVEKTLREVDVRMCKSVGVDPGLGAALMAKLWTRPFSEERDRRAEPGAKPQRKGQISRQLKAELVEEIPR